MEKTKKYYNNLFISLILYLLIHTAFSTIMPLFIRNTGLSLVLALLLSLIPPLYWFGKDRLMSEFSDKREKINIVILLVLCAAAFMINIMGGGIVKVIKDLLNLVGLSISSYSVDVSSDSGEGLSLFLILYSAILAPIAEELVFRLVLFRSIEKVNVRAAILTTGVLFGLMHGNFDQSISVIPLGMFLSYLSHRYSIWVPIVVHITNNLIVNIIAIMGTKSDFFISGIFIFGIISSIIALILLVKYYKEKMNKLPKGKLLYIKTLGFWCFLILNIALIIINEAL